MRLLFFSDLHEVGHGSANSELVLAAREAAPDLILCGGDMIVGQGKDHPSVAPLLLNMSRIAPVYFANGNHETQLAAYEPGAWRLLYSDLRRAGVKMLSNGSAQLEIRENRITVTGLEIALEKYRKFRKPQMNSEELENLIGKRPEEEYFEILLAHNPSFGDLYFDWGADLILSGHNHGGVMRLGGNRILVSPYGFPFPDYGYGLFQRGEQAMIVTSGLGEHTIPVRIHNPMEIVLIEVRPSKGD